MHLDIDILSTLYCHSSAKEVTKLYRYAAELLAEAGCSLTREY